MGKAQVEPRGNVVCSSALHVLKGSSELQQHIDPQKQKLRQKNSRFEAVQEEVNR